ncbi:MAG TPA: hypothetical protein VGG33_24050 [Polyangia bacterium]
MVLLATVIWSGGILLGRARPAAAEPTVPGTAVPDRDVATGVKTGEAAASAPVAGEGAIDSSIHHKRRLPRAAPPVEDNDPGASLLTTEGTPAVKPFYRTWWFWTGVGGAAAAVAVTAVLWNRSDDPSYTKRGSLGTLGGGK